MVLNNNISFQKTQSSYFFDIDKCYLRYINLNGQYEASLPHNLVYGKLNNPAM